MPRFSNAQKQVMMTKLLSSKAGRQKIAASVQGPLRKLRDYQSVGRRAFMIDELADGALPIYDTDIETPSYVVGNEGDSVQTVVKTDRLLVPLFEIAANPTIPFVQAKERRFDVLDRIKKKTKTELFRKEDRKIFAAIKIAALANKINTPIVVARADFKWETIVDAFARVEQHGNRVEKIFMNAIDYPIVRNIGRDHADFETQRELLKTGLMARAYGAEIYTSPEVPKGHVFFCAEPELFGVMPVRIDLTVMPADEPKERRFGWSVFENIGIGIHNPEFGLQAIVVTG